jgi:hypothetical protein
MPRQTWADQDGRHFDVLGSREWALKTSRILVEYSGSGQKHPAPAVLVRDDFWRRPPIGPPLAGKRATAGGRGHRRSASPEAQGERRRLAMQAYRLRTEGGMTIRQIAARLGVGKTTVGRLLYGVLPNDWNPMGDKRVKTPLAPYRPWIQFRDVQHPGHSFTSRWDETSNRTRRSEDD